MYRARIVGVVAGLIGLVVTFSGAGADERPDPDEKLLHEAGAGTSGPALLDFFRRRTLSDATRREIVRLVEQLDSNQFQDRQQASQKLIGIGPAALPALRRATVGQSLELTRRAGHCIREIENGTIMGLPAAAARVLRARKPDGACAVLFDFLPFADDEGTEEVVLAVLADLGMRDGKPDAGIVSAADDPLPVRRMAAAALLARAPEAEYRMAARKLLQDPEARVQVYVARSLLAVQDKSAVPRLLALIDDGPVDVARQADNLLCRIAGERVPQFELVGADVLARGKCRDAWTAWWRANEAKVDLSKLSQEDGLDPELQRLIERSAKIVRESLGNGNPDQPSAQRAHAQAVMIAVYAQSGPGGAHTFRRATLRDGALRLAAALRDKNYPGAQKQARALVYLHPDPRAPVGSVRILTRHIDLEDMMHQFVPERRGGLGVEMKIHKLVGNKDNAKAKVLPREALDDEMVLMAQQVAHVAAWIKDDYKPPNKKLAEWKARADDARQAALDLATAARAKNGKEAWQALTRLDIACCNCHDIFRR